MDKKLYDKVMSGRSDNNIKFTSLRNLIIDLGFEFSHGEGSHEFFYNKEIGEIMNIQDKDGKAKHYQVRQLRKIISKHGLKEGE